VDTADSSLLTVDRTLTPLGGAATVVAWTLEVPAAAALGTTAGVAAGDTTLTWTPALERTAPPVGRTVELASTTVRAGRTVTSVGSDLLQCQQTIAGGGAVTVERLRIRSAGSAGAFDIAAASLSNASVLSLAPVVALSGEAIRLFDTNAAALPTVAAAATYSLMINGAAPLTVVGGGTLVVGTPVLLSAGAARELAVLTTLRATITLDATVNALNGGTAVTYEFSLLNLNGNHGGNVLTSTLPGVAGANGKTWMSSIDADQVWRRDNGAELTWSSPPGYTRFAGSALPSLRALAHRPLRPNPAYSGCAARRMAEAALSTRRLLLP
jgi:hypothetical protein